MAEVIHIYKGNGKDFPTIEDDLYLEKGDTMRYMLKQLRDYNKEVVRMIDIVSINKDDIKARLKDIELYTYSLDIDCKDYAFNFYTALLDNIAILHTLLSEEKDG